MQHTLAKRERERQRMSEGERASVTEFSRVNFFLNNIKSNVLQHWRRRTWTAAKNVRAVNCVCLPMMLTITTILFGKESVRKIVRSNVANSYLNSIYPSWYHIAFMHTHRENTRTHTHRQTSECYVFFFFSSVELRLRYVTTQEVSNAIIQHTHTHRENERNRSR